MIEATDRALLEATLSDLTKQLDGQDLTAALDSFGWSDVLADDPACAVSSLFTAQGQSVVWSSALHDVLTVDLALLDPELEEGTGTVLLPLPAARVSGEVVEGLLVGSRPIVDWVVATTRAPDGSRRVMRSETDAVTNRPSAGLDPSLGVSRVSFRADDAEVVSDGDAAATWWAGRESIGRLALSHQLCGLIEVMLDLAREHAVTRVQFGQLIGTFQAVRTRLAETYVALAATRASAEAAWACSDLPFAASVAKLVASRTCATAVGHCQQVLAGVGYTAEHPFHLAFKQATVLDRLLGSAADLGPEVGRKLIERGHVPRLFELTDR